MISGKDMREIDPSKPKPFPYEKDIDFRMIPGMFEKTTYRYLIRKVDKYYYRDFTLL